MWNLDPVISYYILLLHIINCFDVLWHVKLTIQGMPRDVALMTCIARNNDQNWRYCWIQKLETFENKAWVRFLKLPITIRVHLHFKSMIKLVSILRVLNYSVNRLYQIYIVELQAISAIQICQKRLLSLCVITYYGSCKFIQYLLWGLHSTFHSQASWPV